MRLALLAIPCVLASCGAAFSAEPMAPSDIQTTFFNGQPFTASTQNGTKFRMVFASDGKMAREPLAQPGTKTNGKWKLNVTGFCTTWKSGEQNCFTLVPGSQNKWFVRKITTTIIGTTVAIWSK